MATISEVATLKVGTNKSPIHVKRGDIIGLHHVEDFTDRGTSIQSINRPFVVVSNDLNNKYSPTINVLPLTSKTHKKKGYKFHVLIDGTKYGLHGGYVLALAEQIFTIGKEKVKYRVGHISAEDMKRVDKAIAIQLIGDVEVSYKWENK